MATQLSIFYNYNPSIHWNSQPIIISIFYSCQNRPIFVHKPSIHPSTIAYLRMRFNMLLCQQYVYLWMQLFFDGVLFISYLIFDWNAYYNCGMKLSTSIFSFYSSKVLVVDSRLLWNHCIVHTKWNFVIKTNCADWQSIQVLKPLKVYLFFAQQACKNEGHDLETNTALGFTSCVLFLPFN